MTSASQHPATQIRPYGLALLLIGLTLTVIWLLRDSLAFSNAALLLTLATLIVAVMWGVGPSLVAAALAFVGLDYLTIPPLYTFTVNDPRELIDLIVFFLVALIAGQLAGFARHQTYQARRYADEQRALYKLSSLLNQQTDRAAVLTALRQQLPISLPVRDVALLPDTADPLASHDPASTYLLLRTGEKLYGTLRVDLNVLPSEAQTQLLMACAVQAAMALERIELTEQTRRTTMFAEADQLKTALLRAVSHDLRTPITIIRSGAEHLRRVNDTLPAHDRHDIILTIEEEADRLNRLVGNLLDFSRLDAGAVVLHRDWNALDEVVGDVVAELWQRNRAPRVELALPADLPLLQFDYALLRQALYNIIENAVRYEPIGRQVKIDARADAQGVALRVINHGPNVEDARKQQIMQPFYHAQEGGTGLGLAIAQSIIDLHQGWLRVEDTEGGGATFVITLPCDRALDVNPDR